MATAMTTRQISEKLTKPRSDAVATYAAGSFFTFPKTAAFLSRLRRLHFYPVSRSNVRFMADEWAVRLGSIPKRRFPSSMQRASIVHGGLFRGILARSQRRLHRARQPQNLRIHTYTQSTAELRGDFFASFSSGSLRSRFYGLTA